MHVETIVVVCKQGDQATQQCPFALCTHGTPKANCPCLLADNKRIAEEQAAEEAQQAAEAHAAQSLLVRLAAIERALWGEDFENQITSDRPTARLLPSTMADGLVPNKRARK